MQIEFSKQIFEKKNTDIKSHENPSSGSQRVPCGRTDRETETVKVIAAFRNFARAPKNWQNWVITKPVSLHPLKLSLPNRFILIVMQKMHD